MPGTIPIVLQQQSHPAGEFRHSQLALANTLQVFDGDKDKLILFVMRIQQQPKCEMKLINFCGVLSNDCMLNKQCVGHDRFAPLRALSVDALQLRLPLVTSEGNQSGNKRSHRRRSKKIAKFHQRRLTQKCRDARSFLIISGTALVAPGGHHITTGLLNLADHASTSSPLCLCAMAPS